MTDEDYLSNLDTLIKAAKTAASAEDFAPVYEEMLREVIDVFEGQHTEFMWTDPRFLPWLRSQLDEFDQQHY